MLPLSVEAKLKMLAKAPPPSINFTPWRSLSSAQPRLCRHHGCFRSSRSGGVLVRAGYTRTPLETAGAYQVVDEETGEKFIVWGGADDPPDSPLPPKDVLFWKPPHPASAPVNHNGNEQMAAAETPAVKGLMGFEKLKVHKLRALAKKSPPRKQQVIEHMDERVVKNDQSTYSNDKIEFMAAKKKVNSPGRGGNVSPRKQKTTQHTDEPVAKADQFTNSKDNIDFMATKKKVNSFGRGGNVSRDGKSPQHKDRIQEFKDKIKGTRAKGGEDEPESVVQRNTEPISEYTKIVDGPHKSDARTNDRGSTARLGGWGGGEGGSEPESKYRTTDRQKKERKSSFDSDFFSRKSFRDIGCNEYMIESLKAQSFSRPSNIQAMVFSSIFEGKSCVVADQSGSGKTLAYLAPVIQRLREEELQGVSKSSPQSPRVVILVPTAELASQVLNNCRSISKFGVPFRSMAVTGGFRQKTQLETLQQGVDVVVATPGRFMYLIKEGYLQLTNIRCAVLDEVDILFNDEDFEASLQNLINSSPVTTQYLFATATLPVSIYNKLVEVFPDCNVVMGPGMHRTSPRLEEVLVDCSGDYGAEKSPETAFTNKKTALLRIVEERPVSKTIVFCNKIETCRKVENALKRFDRKGARVKVLPFHAALDQVSRLANMKEFTSPQSKEDSHFLVCTDRASRGIDFPDVDHVILFDFPRDPSEYVRRVGRTARGASGRGKAFALVVGKQVSLAGRIMERNQKGRPLHDVPAAYELFA